MIVFTAFIYSNFKNSNMAIKHSSEINIKVGLDENRVPEKPILVPWEAPITMTPGWSYNENAKYKTIIYGIHNNFYDFL